MRMIYSGTYFMVISTSFSQDIDLIVQIQQPPMVLKHNFVTHRFHDEFDVKDCLLL